MSVASVAAIPQSVATASGPTAGDTALSDMNAFLQLFTTQLQHQDPTKPMDAYEMSAQLAQFSTVEKLTQIHAQLETQQNYLASINNAQGVQFLGKTVTALDNRITVSGGVAAEAGLELDTAADVTVSIFDEAGNLVRTLPMGVLDKGQHPIAWDGTDDSGTPVADGTYIFVAQAVDASGHILSPQTVITQEVYGFRMDDGISYLVLGNANGPKVPVSAIVRVETGGDVGSEDMIEQENETLVETT